MCQGSGGGGGMWTCIGEILARTPPPSLGLPWLEELGWRLLKASGRQSESRAPGAPLSCHVRKGRGGGGGEKKPSSSPGQSSGCTQMRSGKIGSAAAVEKAWEWWQRCSLSLGKSTFREPQDSHGAALLLPLSYAQGVGIQ